MRRPRIVNRKWSVISVLCISLFGPKELCAQAKGDDVVREMLVFTNELASYSNDPDTKAVMNGVNSIYNGVYMASGSSADVSFNQAALQLANSVATFTDNQQVHKAVKNMNDIHSGFAQVKGTYKGEMDANTHKAMNIMEGAAVGLSLLDQLFSKSEPVKQEPEPVSAAQPTAEDEASNNYIHYSHKALFKLYKEIGTPPKLSSYNEAALRKIDTFEQRMAKWDKATIKQRLLLLKCEHYNGTPAFSVLQQWKNQISEDYRSKGIEYLQAEVNKLVTGKTYPYLLNGAVSLKMSGAIAEDLRGGYYKEMKDYATAITYYRKSADKGYSQAMNNIGYMYHLGYGVPQDFQQAMDWYKKAHEKGSDIAMSNIGMLYSNGQGVAQNYREAVSWYRKAADAGAVKGMYNLGHMYYEAKGVEKNNQEALKWWKKAAEEGYVDAMVGVGNIYDSGEGVAKNAQEAIRYWTMAAEKGRIDAMMSVATMYDIGEDVARNPKEAIRYWTMAAEKGNTMAMVNLGAMYDAGEGVTQSLTEALKWWRLAADKGDAEGMMQVGYIYYAGKAIEKNLPEAFSWYKKAAEAGHKVGMQNVAAMYRNGIGVAKNETLAKQWEAKLAAAK